MTQLYTLFLLVTYVSFIIRQPLDTYVNAYSSGQGIPCRESVAGIEHGAPAGNLAASKTIIRINGYVRKPNTIVNMKQTNNNNKIVIENNKMIGILLHLKSNDGKNIVGRYKSTLTNMTKMVSCDDSTEALIHNTSQLKLRVPTLFDATNLYGTLTLSITVLHGYQEWYYDTIQFKILGTAPPTYAPTNIPTKAPVRLCRPKGRSCTSRKQCCSNRCFIRCF
jgi:Reeler domain